MRSRRVPRLVLLATSLHAAAALAPQAILAQPAPGAHSADSAAIHTVWASLDAEWNGRDAERFSQVFAVDANFEFVTRGEAMDTRETIRDTYAERFARFAPDVRHRTTVHVIRAVSQDVHTVDGTVEILRTSAAAGASAAEPTVILSFSIFGVMLRTAEGWKIRVLRVFEHAAE